MSERGPVQLCCKVSEHLLIYHSSDVEVITSTAARMVILIMDGNLKEQLWKMEEWGEGGRVKIRKNIKYQFESMN